MGQQQLLLLILGLIVVGLAIATAIVMFKDNGVAANRDAVTNDLVHLAASAQHYFRRPTTLGGGQGTFAGLTADVNGLKKLTSLPNGANANGVYSISTAGSATTVVLQGLGVETGSDGSSPVKVVMIVWPDSAKVDNTQMN